IHQRSRGLRVELQGFLISLNHFGNSRAGLLQFQASLEPSLGGCASIAFYRRGRTRLELQQPVELNVVEIEEKLAGLSLHGAALDFHSDLLAVRVDLELCKGILDVL